MYDIFKSIPVQLSDALVFKPMRSTPSLMKPVRSIIRENRLDPGSPHALSQLIIVSRITKKKHSHAQSICSELVQ